MNGSNVAVSGFLLPLQNTLTESNPWREGLVSAYDSEAALYPEWVETQGKTLGAGNKSRSHGGEPGPILLHMACSCVLIAPRTTTSAHGELGPPTSIINQENVLQASLVGVIFHLRFPIHN